MAAALSLAVLGLSGCAQSGAKTSAEASAENPMVLTLAHGLSETHTVHIAMTEFADKVEERTNGRIQVRILPNGQLGSENENMEQLMAGVISMTKVSAPGLATYNESYHAFGLPYIFDDTEDFYHVMDSDPMQDFFLSSSDDGFVTLTYYTSGARSFYTKNKAIRTPADLKGLKIRVQDMKSQTDMMKALGGIPVAMSYGDVYTSLQTGLISGQFAAPHWAVKANYQDICKYATDIGLDSTMGELLTVNLTKWNSLPTEVQDIILEVSKELEQYHLEYTNECRSKAYDTFVEAGGTIVTMSDEEKAAWLNALPNIPDTATELGPTGLKILERYVEKENGVNIPRDWQFNY